VKTIEKGRIGSSFDDYLRESGDYEATTERAIKRVLARQIKAAMEENNLTKTAMAARMRTSRQALDRLLDPKVDGLTISTLSRAAKAVGRKIRIDLV
jgi:predicted XRE-type DNA-binding protein